MATYTESYKDVPERVELQEGDLVEINGESFKILKTVGKGGFGSVYHFKDEKIEKDYALKVLNLWEMMPQEFDSLMRRFKQEYIIGKTESPYIVNTYYMGFIKGNPFFIMDFCKHGNLFKNVSKISGIQNYGTIAYQLLTVIGALHDKGYVHRDIKPENVLVDGEFNMRLTDFGISTQLDNRLTSVSFFGKAQEIFVSYIYSPPEQMDTSQYYSSTKPTMDIYSFGVTMYYLLSRGETPFGDINVYKADPKKYIQKKKTTIGTPLKIYNPNLPEKWYQIIEKCIQPKKSDRYQSVYEIIIEFEEYKNNRIFIHDFQLNGKGRIQDEIETGKSEEKEKTTACLIFPQSYPLQTEINLVELINKKPNSLLSIGRENKIGIKNDINIGPHEVSVSKRQATLECRNGDWYIKDGQFHDGEWNFSSNGTYHNKRKIEELSGTKLSNGDILRIGRLQMKFRLK